MSWIFSDRHRLSKVGISIFLLLVLALHTHIVGSRYGHEKFIFLENCLKNSNPCVGLSLAMHAEIREAANSTLIAFPRIRKIYQSQYSLSLTGNIEALRHGYEVDILGIFTPDGQFFVTKYQRADWIRPVKYAVSLLGLTFTVILFSRRYRFAPKRLFPLSRR